MVKETSVAWKYFTKDGNKVICNLCNASLTKQDRTSNMRNHLRACKELDEEVSRPDMYKRCTRRGATQVVVVVLMVNAAFCHLYWTYSSNKDDSYVYGSPKKIPEHYRIKTHAPDIQYYRNKTHIQECTEIDIQINTMQEMSKTYEDTQQINTLRTTCETNRKRQEHLQSACKHLTSKKRQTPAPRAMMDPDKSTLYCHVNKVASKFNINKIENIFNTTGSSMRLWAQKLKNISYKTMESIVSRSFKYTFVREPYGRLFSAYGDRLYFPHRNYDVIGKAIIKKYRIKPSADSLRYGLDVTFAEFIEYVIKEFETPKKMDFHIRPMHQRCHPCHYDYDFIGKLETLRTDWKYIIHEWTRMKIMKEVPSPLVEEDTTIYHTMHAFPEMLEFVRNSSISTQSMYTRVWNYFQMVGKLSKHLNMPFGKTEFQSDNIAYDTFVEELKTAITKSAENATEVKGQRKEALLQAYSTVTKEDLERLRKVVLVDCLLYGYEVRPDWLFDKQPGGDNQDKFDYFKGLSIKS